MRNKTNKQPKTGIEQNAIQQGLNRNLVRFYSLLNYRVNSKFKIPNLTAFSRTLSAIRNNEINNKMKKIIISTIISTILLFIWGGLSQMLPWGISTTQNVNVQSEIIEKQSEAPNLIKLQSGELTTEKFESQFGDKISTYVTDNTFSWIITQPYQKDYSGYFIKEFITQLIVGLLLAIILFLTIKLELKSRIFLIVIFGLCASTSIYGQMMNWWGIPADYAIGVSINLIIGWVLAAYISARFILKSQNE